MKLRYNFVVNEVADKMVAVAVGDDLDKFNGFIKMNKVAADIFSLLKDETSEEEVVEGMKKLYPDDKEEEIIETVHGFVDKLFEAGVLE